MARSTHNEMQELVGAYALDALEADETDGLELHLAECPRCRADLREFRETAAMLAHAGTAAPEGLWDKITAELEEAPPDIAKVFRMPTGSERDQRERMRGPRWRTVGMAAAGIAAAIIAVNSTLLVRQSQRIHDISGDQTISSLADQAAANPTSKLVSVRSADGSISADVVMRPNGSGYLLHTRMPPLDKKHTYQLWGLADGHSPVSLSVLGANPKVASFTAKLPLNTLAITVEEAQGATVPSELPRLTGVLNS